VPKPVYFDIDPAPKLEALQIIHDGLHQHNDAFAPAGEDRSFAVFLGDADGRILGGVIARAGRGWLKIGRMWVDESVRGQGFDTASIEP
jgi:hypothetical protein